MPMKINTKIKTKRMRIPIPLYTRLFLCALLSINYYTASHASLVSLKPAGQAPANALNATDVIHHLNEQYKKIKAGEFKTLPELLALFEQDSVYAQAQQTINQAQDNAGTQSAALKNAHATIESLSTYLSTLLPTLSQKMRIDSNPLSQHLAAFKKDRAALHQEYLFDPVKRTARNVAYAAEEMAIAAIPAIIQKIEALNQQKLRQLNRKLRENN